MILFSIVMPSCKTDELTMRRAISCVKKQTFTGYELLIIDDNDDNEYKEINKKLEKEIDAKCVRFLFYEKNMGANYARNQGIKQAKGDFIAFLDADDEWFPSYLESCAELIKSRDATFITSNYQVVSQKGIQQPYFNYETKYEGNIYERELLYDCVGPSSAVCVQRQVLLNAGLFDVTLPARQDYDMWIRVSKTNPLHLIYSSQMYIYRDGHDSISKSYQRNVEGTKIILDKLMRLDLSHEIKGKIQACQLRHMAIYCIHGGRQEEAIPYFKQSNSFLFSWKNLIYSLLCYIPSSFVLLRKIRKCIVTIKIYNK